MKTSLSAYLFGAESESSEGNVAAPQAPEWLRLLRAALTIALVAVLLVGSYIWASSNDDPRKDFGNTSYDSGMVR